MKKNKNYGLLGILAFFIIKFIISYIGVENISAQIIIIILLMGNVMIILGINKKKLSSEEKKYYILIEIIVIIMSITIAMLKIKGEFMKEGEFWILVTIFILSLISLIVVGTLIKKKFYD